MKLNKAPVKKNPDVVCTSLQNGDSVLLHLDTQTYYSLNPTGVFIWEKINGVDNMHDIARALERQYDVSIEEAERSTSSLLDELAKEQLVSFASEE